ncbi:MAG: chemotaxis protein CheW [Thermoguttaceae bacterium]|jgi:two-component system chemotaxis response regulator CheV|nr:chemotaxis protein CheW [Thermoguttaceae bacterium]
MSTTMSNLLLDKEILLESGTNELELLVFDVADYTFGINVAKVREVLPTTEITRLPKAHSSVRGVFKLRNRVIPCVSLLDHLGIAPTWEQSEGTMILTDFNQQQTAFLVDTVERIHRLSWQNILSVPGLEALSHTPVTALARCENRLVVMLDFEMILDDVTDQYFRTDTVDNPMGLPREELRILLAEDSPTVREAVGNTLRSSGYTHVTFFENGAEAWKWIEQRLAEPDGEGGVADLVISDVEMPQVDGFHLTKRIKDHPVLQKIPVLLYSSIITPDNHKKGRAVGADAQIAKPELKQIVALADELIAAAQKGERAEGLRKVADMIGATTSPDASAAKPVSKPASRPAAAPGTASAGREPKQQPAPPVPEVECSLPATAVPVPDLPPAESPPPSGVSPALWATFRDELADRIAELRQQLTRVSAGGPTGEILREVARTLHTIKSAAMVLPLDPVTRCTHLVEGLLEPAKETPAKWPQAALVCYTDWLWTLIHPQGTTDEGLAQGAQLEAELARASGR